MRIYLQRLAPIQPRTGHIGFKSQQNGTQPPPRAAQSCCLTLRDSRGSPLNPQIGHELPPRFVEFWQNLTTFCHYFVMLSAMFSSFSAVSTPILATKAALLSIVKHFSRSTRLTYLCTASNSNISRFSQNLQNFGDLIRIYPDFAKICQILRRTGSNRMVFAENVAEFRGKCRMFF